MTPPHNSEREARILQEARSEYIIPLISKFWQPGGRLVLVFPFMPIDLDTLMRSSSLDPNDVTGIARDLFKGLVNVHLQGIIHRDVKPSNILLRSKRGAAYLADFGIAWSPNDPTSESAQNKITDVGTTSYRPPELLFGYSAYDTSLDLWAAGCTVAEMLRANHKSVFDAGDLGSELALIKSIFETLGTPNESLWPVRCPHENVERRFLANHMFSQSVKYFPDWGKMRFVEYPAKPWETILNGASNLAIDFVSRLIQYEGSRRMTASQVQHSFLNLPSPYTHKLINLTGIRSCLS
jgi:serine/threonine protein kinase